MALYLAQDQLTQPQAKPLFPDPSRAVQQDRLGESSGTNRLRQAVPDCIMTVQRAKTHGRECT
jgi:hypothetical protein